MGCGEVSGRIEGAYMKNECYVCGLEQSKHPLPWPFKHQFMTEKAARECMGDVEMRDVKAVFKAQARVV